ncbi:MAG TPA: hypothetical protein VGM25_01970 [Caulobacteraceae bacterium]|jgi:hypothetical protein
MRLAAISAIVLLAAGSQAEAQTPAQAAPAASEAQRLLQGAPNPRDFANLSSGGLTSLKHKPSGLICQFGPDPQGNSLKVSPEGVICETSSATEIDTLEAFHIPHASASDIQEAMGRAMGQFGGAQPVSGFTDSQSDRAGAPPHVSRRFVAALPSGQQLFVRIAYSQVGDWFVLQRVITTPADAKLADGDAERRLLAVIGQVMDGQGKGR